MMKFIAILLVVVSSSKMTYHKEDHVNNLCASIVFDDSGCSDLKQTLTDQQFTAGPCPNTRETNCSADQDEGAQTIIALWNLGLSVLCGFDQDKVHFEYYCVQPSDKPVDEPVDEPAQPRTMETYHVSSGETCAYVEFDVNACPGMKEALTTQANEGEQFSSGPCPSMYTKTSCEDSDEAPKAGEVASRKLALGGYCTIVDDYKYEVACGPRMKTFHKIDASSGFCEYVDFDRFECNGLADHLESDPAFLPGPCPDTHEQHYCDSTTGKEMDFARAAWTFVYGTYCNLDLDELTYGYACEEGRGSVKCPEACANAIAADSSTASDFENETEATGFCRTIFTEGQSHDFPDACSDMGETTLGLCMTELYEKCVSNFEDLSCPIPDYGLPYKFRDCKGISTCGQWKEAFDTGCAKEASACIKDEAQGDLKCTIHGKDLIQSSSDPCGKTKSCTKSGEFCNYNDNSENGKCELCSHSLCALLTNGKAKAECLQACGEDECTTGRGCDDSCERPAKTCMQLKDMMETPNGCGRTCNQCHIDVLNAQLQCDGKYKVQSRIDGDSASALSILMLASIAILLWI